MRGRSETRQPDLFAAGAGERVAGVDEAGRGPLAGAVYAAAVILDPARPIAGLADSKVLEANVRESLASEIRANSIAWAVAFATVAEIDRLNILHATMLAMRRAVLSLTAPPDEVWVDGNRCPRVPYLVRAIVKGDALVPAISAASILAKTERDAALVALDREFPKYGFAKHKGYPTPEHLDALARHGPCLAHRLSFAPVRNAGGAES